MRQKQGCRIDPDRIHPVEHSKQAGLQVADAVASGFHIAVKVNRYGETGEGSALPGAQQAAVFTALP